MLWATELPPVEPSMTDVTPTFPRRWRRALHCTGSPGFRSPTPAPLPAPGSLPLPPPSSAHQSSLSPSTCVLSCLLALPATSHLARPRESSWDTAVGWFFF